MALRRFYSHLIDEATASVLLHTFLRHRGHPPVSGKAVDCHPGLLSGDLRSFFAPIPQAVDLDAVSVSSGEEPDYAVEDFQFPSSVLSPFPRNNTVRVPVPDPRSQGFGGDVQMRTISISVPVFSMPCRHHGGR